MSAAEPDCEPAPGGGGVDVGPRNYEMKNNTAFYSMHLRVRVDRCCAARRGPPRAGRLTPLHLVPVKTLHLSPRF